MSTDRQPDAASRLAAHLGMAPIPHEGPLFVRTYESAETFGALPARYTGTRAGCTAILALITAENFSALHRLATDELWFFHAGSPLELLLLHPGGRSEIVIVGADVLGGQRPQACVPRGSWVGARPLGSEPGAYALISNTLAPGFDYADYEPGDRAALIDAYPERAGLIKALTRAS
ncbi:MAG: cupin domain-containing protein [Opitutaceae bacterium]|nr:cupin domain-containing protein [Opitutaceae bacterium]